VPFDMRVLEYVVLPGVGGEETALRGTVAQLLLDIPYLIVGGLIPPLPVLNQVLDRGSADAGMSGGCRWEPFSLSEPEFAELVAELSTRGGKRGESLRFDAPPGWVDTQRSWGVWLAYRLHSIPVDENLRLSQAMQRVTEAMERAAKEGDEVSRVEHLVELSRLAGQWSDFVQKHRAS
jgi:hypothetical protein